MNFLSRLHIVLANIVKISGYPFNPYEQRSIFLC